MSLLKNQITGDPAEWERLAKKLVVELLPRKQTPFQVMSILGSRLKQHEAEEMKRKLAEAGLLRILSIPELNKLTELVSGGYLLEEEVHEDLGHSLYHRNRGLSVLIREAVENRNRQALQNLRKEREEADKKQAALVRLKNISDPAHELKLTPEIVRESLMAGVSAETIRALFPQAFADEGAVTLYSKSSSYDTVKPEKPKKTEPVVVFPDWEPMTTDRLIVFETALTRHHGEELGSRLIELFIAARIRTVRQDNFTIVHVTVEDPEVKKTLLYTGVSKCHPGDAFRPAIGQYRALARAARSTPQIVVAG